MWDLVQTKLYYAMRILVFSRVNFASQPNCPLWARLPDGSIQEATAVPPTSGVSISDIFNPPSKTEGCPLSITPPPPLPILPSICTGPPSSLFPCITPSPVPPPSPAPVGTRSCSRSLEHLHVHNKQFFIKAQPCVCRDVKVPRNKRSQFFFFPKRTALALGVALALPPTLMNA